VPTAGPKSMTRTPQPEYPPEPHRAASFAAPEQLPYWPQQPEEVSPAAQSWWRGHSPSAPPEAPPEPKLSYPTAAASPMERPREWAPLSASAPPVAATRSPDPAIKPRVVAPLSQPEPVFFAHEIPEPREPEKSRTPAIPKLLKRLMNAGRPEFPPVPEFVSAEAEMSAAISAENMAATPVASHEASITPLVSPSPMPRAELKPVADNLDDLRLAQRDLRNTVTEQSGVLERVQDQVQILCETADRGAQEQQQLVDELKFFSKWAFVFAIAVALLLFASVAFDVVLLLRQ
jgi:hypothetical protein